MRGDQVDLLGTSLAVLMEENADKIGPDRILHPDHKLFPIRDEVKIRKRPSIHSKGYRASTSLQKCAHPKGI